jgi:ubiquinone/menaquinone biosynthesis C-methylase UbiE
MSTYVFEQQWHRERDRLRSLETTFHDNTTRVLADRGIEPGARCLEVGGGAGAIAWWLADRVGSTGRVVVTDLDPRFLDGHGRDNVDVRQHDITIDSLDPASFDLVHGRAVLEHIPERRKALGRMIEATRPGGWVVVEDVFFGGPMNDVSAAVAAPAELAEAYPAMSEAIAKVFAAIGADANFAPRLPALMVELGLGEVGGQFFAPVLRGGGSPDWVRLTLEHLRGPLVANGLASGPEIERALGLFETGVCYLPPVMVSAWGRRPVE